MDGFNSLRELGKGSFATVYLAKRIEDNALYAMKKIRIDPLNEEHDKEMLNAFTEVRVIHALDHPNVITYRQSFVDKYDGSLSIVMDYCDGGDLQRLIKHYESLGQPMPEEDIWAFFIQIVRGVKALHDKKILHRDLKSANILVTKEMRLLVSDFNVCKILDHQFGTTQTGSPYYAAPEMWKGHPQHYSVDIWAIGCLLYEMACYNPPFDSIDMPTLYKDVVESVPGDIPEVYSDDLNDMVFKLLKKEPQNRPTCD